MFNVQRSTGNTKTLMENYWQLNIQELEKTLTSDLSRGLSSFEANERLKKYGFNQLVEKKGTSGLAIFLGQFSGFIVWILLSAALVSGLLREWLDAIAILAIIIINAVLGFIQEFRAEKAIAALKKLSAPAAKVVRDGELKIIPAKELVPGDLIQIEAGDHIPADGRLIQVAYFQTLEASLTGESVPIEKYSEELNFEEIPLAERKNAIYLGTQAVSGKAKAIVVNTGMNTELGKIAEMIEEAGKEATPLQQRLSRLGKWLVYFCLGIVIIIFFLGIIRGIPFIEMFLTAVSLAVAAIPEGLPAVVTIALALGVQRMVKRNALIRKLPSVETLGSTNVICSDKTGTLTQNEMTVRRIWTSGKLFTVTGIGYNPQGEFELTNQTTITDYKLSILLPPKRDAEDGQITNYKSADLKTDADLLKTLRIGILCNNSTLSLVSSPFGREGTGEGSQWNILGDPTEGAILTVAGKAGLWKNELEKRYPLIAEIPFESERKLMSIIRRSAEDKTLAFVKGAPDILLSHSQYLETDGKIEELTEEGRKKILSLNQSLARQALRVLAVGYRYLDNRIDKYIPQTVEENLIFVGLIGMIDPPRPEVQAAIATCRKAGIRSVMITGDHKETALAIADELGMTEENSLAFTGSELDKISDEELVEKVENIAIYARVSPEHKLRIVRAWKKRNAIVAMTGDGVNDAPALKEADIGIAMGITGTDVTKEAADMVITDDNFASIVAAVEEGRTIYQNIRKFVYYLLSCNTGEVLVLFFSSLLGWPLPLLPIQILWTNLITDGFPALALGVDKPEPDLMTRPAQKTEEGIINKRFIFSMLAMGTIIAFCSLFAFGYVLFVEKEDLVRARTAAFVVLVCAQLFHSFNSRSERISIFKLGLLTNKNLLFAVSFSLLLQMGIVYLTFVQPIFKTSALNLFDWTMVVVLSSLPLWIIELVKITNKKIGR